MMMMAMVFQNRKRAFKKSCHATLQARLLPDLYSEPICWQICTAEIFKSPLLYTHAPSLRSQQRSLCRSKQAASHKA